MKEKLIKNLANGLFCGYQLQDLADTVRVEVVHVPANDVPGAVSGQSFAQCAVTLFFGGLFEKPTQGIFLIVRAE